MNSPDIVVVSGAGTGIGRAVSHRLVADGFHVIAVGRRPAPLELLAKELAPHLDAVSADLETAEGAATVAERVRIADRISSAGRRCAGVVAAAGGLSPRRASIQGHNGDPGLNGDRARDGDGALDDVPGLERVPELDGVRQDWLASFESNVLTAVLLVEALREAIERGNGRVVLLSSVAALRGSGGGPYGAAKAALHAFVYDLARDLGSWGGTANVVAPGFVPDTRVLGGPAHQRVPA